MRKLLGLAACAALTFCSSMAVAGEYGDPWWRHYHHHHHWWHAYWQPYEQMARYRPLRVVTGYVTVNTVIGGACYPYSEVVSSDRVPVYTDIDYDSIIVTRVGYAD